MHLSKEGERVEDFFVEDFSNLNYSFIILKLFNGVNCKEAFTNSMDALE